MERVILHCDANSYYASVECLYTPSIRQKPVAVCGEQGLPVCFPKYMRIQGAQPYNKVMTG